MLRVSQGLGWGVSLQAVGTTTGILQAGSAAHQELHQPPEPALCLWEGESSPNPGALGGQGTMHKGRSSVPSSS